jgi:hypothetical protein
MDIGARELTREDMIVVLVKILIYLISPILFIWSVNTLFACGTPFTFKTWFAGFGLIALIRYHLKRPVSA